MQLPENYGLALLLTFIAGLATAIGAGLAFIVKRNNMRALSVGLGFSAGVMIFLSFNEIIPEAEHLLQPYFPNDFHWIVYAGFIVGIIIAILIDFFIPDHIDIEELEDPDAPCLHRHKLKRAGMFTAIAICVHNFPEGIATFLTATQDVALGVSVALAIAIHNIPEGIAVALPIYHVTGKKRYAMLYAALSGLSEPVGALVGLLIFSFLLPQMLVGAIMAAVAGIMIYLAFDTLLPLAKEYGDWHLSLTGIISGILFIWFGLIVIG